MPLQKRIEDLWNSNRQQYAAEDHALFDEFRDCLTRGQHRAAEKIDGRWVTNTWVKKGILLGFRMGQIVKMSLTDKQWFTDKDTYPLRFFEPEEGVRMVPGGSSVRSGAYVGKSVILMPPMYINVGAWVDDGTMVDSHALIGSCAQIGKRVHVSAGTIIGGVLEPVGANPVIVEDDVFIGGNCGLFEGVIVQREAILATGVNLTASTAVFDAVNNRLIRSDLYTPLIIPARAVVVPGNRPLRANPEYSIYCPIIVKYRDTNTDAAVTLEHALR